ncbi:matrixin family metalloprotease [Pseudoduganella sp. RAF19]|uniref:matrixin family metalloprotease n=2 Tax=unclassified Pseudoduganella TaxID=2637179 RepID=UPI003F947FCF
MATVSQVTSTTLSGLNYIDSLLGNLPNWNYLTPGTNTIYYTFSTSANLESGNSAILSKPVAFSASQQVNTRTAMAYVAKLTGINFVETADATKAQVHFADANISGSNTTGQDSSHYGYSYTSGSVVTKFTASSYVYLDNAEWAGMNANLTPGTQGYETLLHEIGHMLGLKHSFEGSIKLPSTVDNTAHTLMSYTHSGGVHSTFSEYDVAALKWLYGGDGLAGSLGVNSTTGARYLAGTSLADTLTGTAANDKLEGDGGNDTLNGGGGIDTAVFNGASSAYSIVHTGTNTWTVSGAEGIDKLSNIEILQFTDHNVTLSTTALAATAAATTVASTANVAGTANASSGALDQIVHDDHVQLIGHHSHFVDHHAIA